MTINEIEATLHTLEKRHPNLTEDTLLTLLKASSWEERQIKEALTVWKTIHTPPAEKMAPFVTATEVTASVPEEKTTPTKDFSPQKGNDPVYYDSTGAEEKKLEHFTDSGKDIPVIKDGVDLSYVETKAVEPEKTPQAGPSSPEKAHEPESLVTTGSSQSSGNKTVEPPSNLPLKPFESSDHVWPLSKYHDVFHGDVPPVVSRVEAKLIEEHKDEHVVEKPEKTVKLKRTEFDGEDEGLIVLTGVSLLVVLLLLAYMYSNGRL